MRCGRSPVDGVTAAVAVGVAVLLGAITQRLTGVGFALVAAPLLVLALGPVQGIVITNVFGVATALTVYLFHAREVEYRRVLPILAFAGVAVIPGALLVAALPAPVLAVAAGVLVVAALALSVFTKPIPHIEGWPGRMAAGLLSGFMNVVAGVGGPAITAYAVAARWEHRAFAITVQFYFVVLGSLSILVRGVVPDIPPAAWISACTALAVGIVVGRLLGRRIPVRVARRACIALAFAGGFAVIARGVIELAA